MTERDMNSPLVEVEALGEEHKVSVPLLEEVPGPGHLGLAGVLAQAAEVDLLFLHVVTHTDVVEVRGDVDESVGHDRVPVLRQDFIYEKLKPVRRKHSVIAEK